jgi:hypothetical protein
LFSGQPPLPCGDYHAADDIGFQERRHSGQSRARYFRGIPKRITEDFGFSIGRTYTRTLVPVGPNAHGWQNLETTFKYQFLTWPQSEFVLSGGVAVE